MSNDDSSGNEWLPHVVAAPETKRLSDAITRGFDKARGSGAGRHGRLEKTLINPAGASDEDIRRISGGKKKRRIEVSWVESRLSSDGGEVDLRPVKSTMRGYLLRETKGALVVASLIVDKRAVGAIVAIPKRAVTRRIDG